MLFCTSQSQAAGKGAKNPAECPRLEMKDADVIVKKIIPDGKAVDIKESPVKGVWQIDVEKGGQRGSIFHRLLEEISDPACRRSRPISSKCRPATPQKVDISKIPLDDSITVGAKTAAKKVIVFSDPDCPYCRQLHDEHEADRGKEARHRVH